MAAVEFQLDPRDRETYDGPEWVVFDKDQLDDLTFADLDRYERELGVSITHLLTGEFAKATALGVKGVVWLARQMAGESDTFADFNIRTRRIRMRPAGGGVNPPPSGSSEPSSEAAA